MAQIEKKRRILVTGATGFAGRALVPALYSAGWQVRACGRDALRKPVCDEFLALDLAEDKDLDFLVSHMDAVVHLAARVHVMRETSGDPMDEFRRANVDATARLVDAAIRNHVRHFVFASSLKVHGESSGKQAFRETDPLLPEDAYSVSKLEAERLLMERNTISGITTTIFRLPLMYGPGVKGNFLRLAHLVARDLPLPFALSDNRRSMLFIGNFCSAVLASLEHSESASRTFLLSDGHDVSTSELIRRIARAFGRPARLFPLPVALLRVTASMAGFGGEIRRLTDSLQVDISHICKELDWNPPYSFDEGIDQTIKALTRETDGIWGGDSHGP